MGIKALHEHDCEECVLLGQFRDVRKGELDVHYCQRDNELIIRHGPDEEYRSFPPEVARVAGSSVAGSPVWAVASAMLDLWIHQTLNPRDPS